MYRALIEKRTEIIDCRMISLVVDFFDLTKEQEQELAEYYAHECKRLFGEHFYIGWLGDFFLAKPDKVLKESPYGHDFCIASTLKSEDVYNLRTFLKYYRDLCYPKVILPSLKSDSSADYFKETVRYWQEPFSPETCKNAILEIFRKPNMKYLNYGQKLEAGGIYHSCYYSNNKNKFRGQFAIDIQQYCLSDQIDDFSEKLVRIATEISEQYVNVNARIFWSCGGEPYWNFYRDKKLQDGSHIQAGCEANEWYEYYHLKSAEWFNILSPLQQTHFDDLSTKARNYETISVRNLSSGGVVVALNKKLSQVDILDLYDMKDLLYDGLQPGIRSVLLKNLYDLKEDYGKPRSLWQFVPVFDDEVLVLEDRVVFKHRAYPLDLNALK